MHCFRCGCGAVLAQGLPPRAGGAIRSTSHGGMIYDIVFINDYYTHKSF